MSQRKSNYYYYYAISASELQKLPLPACSRSSRAAAVPQVAMASLLSSVLFLLFYLRAWVQGSKVDLQIPRVSSSECSDFSLLSLVLLPSDEPLVNESQGCDSAGPKLPLLPPPLYVPTSRQKGSRFGSDVATQYLSNWFPLTQIAMENVL